MMVSRLQEIFSRNEWCDKFSPRYFWYTFSLPVSQGRYLPFLSWTGCFFKQPVFIGSSKSDFFKNTVNTTHLWTYLPHSWICKHKIEYSINICHFHSSSEFKYVLYDMHRKELNISGTCRFWNMTPLILSKGLDLVLASRICLLDKLSKIPYRIKKIYISICLNSCFTIL